MSASHADVATHGEVNYLNHDRSLWSWLSTVDHKRIGLLYLGVLIIFFFIGGVAALLLRTKLAFPGHTIVDANTYNRLFTIHGAVMIFLFIVPGIPATLGNFLLPLMIGAKDVAFPRLNLLSYYVYLVGAVMALVSL